MQGRIRVSGVGVETLAQHETGLSMRIAARCDERNIRRQRHVAGNLFPYEMKGVVREPHVFAATGDAIASARSIAFDRAGATRGPDVGVAVEGSNRRGARFWQRMSFGVAFCALESLSRLI